MKYAVIPPCEELKHLISHFWVGTWDEMSQKPHTTYYLIASSLAEITFAFRSNHKHADLLFSTVQGHTHLPNQFSVDGFYHLIGVSFHSYAIPALFHMPASELNKAFIPLSTFLGCEGTMLNERMAMATTAQERIQILSDYFISRLKKQKWEDKRMTSATKEIRKCGGKTTIEALAHDCCLSQKQFTRRFKAFSGFSPKMYARIIRFESVIHHYSNTSSLTEMAYASGYYDQAHFVHEFKSFTGFTPKDFWKLSEEHP